MRRTEQAQGLRLMKFEEVYGQTAARLLSQAEAAEILGVSERTFRRWRDRYEADGAEGLYDRRLGRVSARRAPVDEVARVLALFDTRYWDFTAKHAPDRRRPATGWVGPRSRAIHTYTPDRPRATAAAAMPIHLKTALITRMPQVVVRSGRRPRRRSREYAPLPPSPNAPARTRIRPGRRDRRPRRCAAGWSFPACRTARRR